MVLCTRRLKRLETPLKEGKRLTRQMYCGNTSLLFKLVLVENIQIRVIMYFFKGMRFRNGWNPRYFSRRINLTKKGFLDLFVTSPTESRNTDTFATDIHTHSV